MPNEYSFGGTIFGGSLTNSAPEENAVYTAITLDFLALAETDLISIIDIM